ncbi:hypothetical protein DFJ58DRAFT_808004 [Suillus subalutaceus]|uniref:uncharacterized protein n=1 Tax=Suillus subalutaceus TaxID=48586 RepID=UPI001B87D9CB|nr:uncharacterized protein DFJ58DRAFT_808004 [Suillus subalutaceus]KAG1841531.1 hypothetical protein DFJ58DRAFT_808004 [Suillus subalutaceus]
MRFRSSVFVILHRWLGSDPEYDKWSHSELRSWLKDHHIKVPTHFDQSQLHDLVAANWASPPPTPPSFAEQSHRFCSSHGVVAPSGPREQLVLLAKQKYRSYTDAASYYSSLASETATSAYSDVTDTLYDTSKSASSIVAQATQDVGRAFDDGKDYIHSTWDDSRLRSWLEDHGVIEARKTSTHSELMKLANDYCRTAVEPVWNAWSDSYMREWLVSHNLLSPSDTASRSTLLGEMNKYYYSSHDKVWSAWSDSELKYWLVKHGLLKSDAPNKRDELVKMVEDNYASASDSVWDAWNDSDIRQWLSEHGYTDDRTVAQKKRDELVSLIDKQSVPFLRRASKYPDILFRYNDHGVNEAALPTNRPGLLQETRIRWTIFTKLQEIVNSSIGAVEDRLARILELLSGHSHHTSEKADDYRAYVEDKKDSAWHWCSQMGDDAKGKGGDYTECAKSKAKEEGFDEKMKRVREGIKWGGEKTKSAGDEL